jgi:3-oxoacid CoA-transferase subunit A
MQTIIIIINLMLSVIGFMYIYSETYTKEKHILNAAKYVVSGAGIATLISFVIIMPITISNVLTGLLLGILCGELPYIFYLVNKSKSKDGKSILYFGDSTPEKYYITGDKHRNFDYVKNFCRDINTRKKDVLIILGDAGFNYYGDCRDDKLKKKISNLNITLFCLHGNKENRPQNIGTYGIRSFCGGKVYYEPKYPNIYFAIDGEIYTFEGKKYMVVGGAHSVDKMRCLEEDRPFWEDEMPDDIIKERVEEALINEDNKIYGMMTHTCPIDYLPTEMFVSTRQNAEIKRKPKKYKSRKIFKPDIDRSTEEWLGKIEKQLDYNVWYCGHYHVNIDLKKEFTILYGQVRKVEE